MSEYDTKNKESPLFVVTGHYMMMVTVMVIKPVRTRDWQLHLLSLELFTKYFFAHDKINYARMIPVYRAEMAALKDVRANCFCASLLRTKFTRHVMHRARALTSKVNNNRANGHCCNFGWI